MKDYEVVGYVYNADVHCVLCARQAIGNPDAPDAEDAEGNPIHAIFAGEEDAEVGVCGDCGAALLED